MRRGELLALKWKDIDLVEGVLQVQRAHVELKGKGVIESEPKTAKGRRTIPLPPFAVEVLNRHRVMHIEKRQKANAWQERDLVFCTAHGTPYGAGYVRKVFKPLLRKAHLPDIRFHDLRHSAATLLLSLGVHPKVVQERLGHSTISLTMDLYSHVLPTMQKDAATRLNDVLERKSEGDV